MTSVRVTSAAELLDALATADDIEVDGSLAGMPMITLRPGVTLRGGTLRFGAKGVWLTSDNLLEDANVIVPDWEVAIGNDTAVADLGRLTVRNVRARGQVLLLAGDAVRRGHVEVDGLTVVSADLRGRPDRPHGFGVDAMQGAFTLWRSGRRGRAAHRSHRQGANDMVLDNWGQVGDWTARAPITSHGPSGIGFVNFGTLDRLDVQAPVTTYGVGARGFNVYDGSLDSARFESITTHADGAVGVQVSRALPVLDIAGSVTTNGSRGTSLVRGVQIQLSAIAVSVQPTGRIGRLSVGGSLSSHGDDVVTLDVEGAIDTLKVQHGITAAGAGSDAVHLAGQAGGLDEVTVTAAHGPSSARQTTDVCDLDDPYRKEEKRCAQHGNG